MAAVVDSFGPPPASLPPSTKVRRWDTALLFGGIAFTGMLLGVSWALWHSLPGFPTVPDGGWLHQLAAYPGVLRWSLTPNAPLWKWADNPASGQVSTAALHVRLLPAWLAAAAAGSWAALHVLMNPQSMTGHVSGPRLLEGKEAVLAAKRVSAEACEGMQGWLNLHPGLDLPRRFWTRHMLIYGGVGSGKTQIMLPVINQVMDRINAGDPNFKLFCLDTKGDFTSRFPTACILSPFDRRSRYWDIAADCQTGAQASAFAASIIPDDNGPNRYFSVSAQLILTGCIRALQTSKGVTWTWRDLDTLLSVSAATLAPVLEEHYKKAHPMVSGSEGSTASVMATLAAFTLTISQLAEAFGDGTRSDGSPRKRLSLVAWAKDGYSGKKAIIAQAGPDPDLTQRYLAAAINILVPEIISPSLPDDVRPDGRGIVFCIDELASVGKISGLGPLCALGRSKGCSIWMGVQSTSQIAATYGDHFAKALTGMVGTHLVCQMQMGETRDQVASLLGSRRVSIHSAPTASTPGTVHEEQRQLVQPAELTTMLGFRKGKKYGPEGFGIRAIANLGGEDLLLLDWPGVSLPELRPAFIPARWMRPAAHPSKKPAKATDADDRPSNAQEHTLLADVIANVAPVLKRDVEPESLAQNIDN